MNGSSTLSPLPQGPVREEAYRALLEAEPFARMEKFSDSFIDRHREALSRYSRRWVRDPFHQWSRQWEYPFVHSVIKGASSAGEERPLRIFDAGSGATFFPYYLSADVAGAELTCCDRDPALGEVYARINGEREGTVDFLSRDLADTGLREGSCDFVYCMSVLEHCLDRGGIIREMSRVLKSGGLFILTFDISLDGLGRIALEELGEMAAEVEKYFVAADPGSWGRLLDRDEVCHARNVTTSAAAHRDRSLLPWRHPWATTLLAALKRGKIPRHMIRNFTFSCHVLENRDPMANGGESAQRVGAPGEKGSR
jgi:SAM-dependent methyltransferase